MKINNKKEITPPPSTAGWVIGGIIALAGLFLFSGAVSVVLGGLFAFFWNNAGFNLKFTWLQSAWMFMALATVAVQFGVFQNSISNIMKTPAKSLEEETEEELEE